MIKNPKHGWCTFSLGTFVGTPSYLTDVPMDLLDVFINYFENGYSAVVFDEEGTDFTLVMTAYNDSIFIIAERYETPTLHNFSNFNVRDLANELINDLESDLHGWSLFLANDDPEEIKLHRDEIRQKIAKLKKMMEK